MHKIQDVLVGLHGPARPQQHAGGIDIVTDGMLCMGAIRGYKRVGPRQVHRCRLVETTSRPRSRSWRAAQAGRPTGYTSSLEACGPWCCAY